MATQQIPGEQIKDNTITGVDIAEKSIPGTKLEDGAITDLQISSISANKLNIDWHPAAASLEELVSRGTMGLRVGVVAAVGASLYVWQGLVRGWEKFNSDRNVDGGSANAIYLDSQVLNGGGALG
jgi:hypothetical protein